MTEADPYFMGLTPAEFVAFYGEMEQMPAYTGLLDGPEPEAAGEQAQIQQENGPESLLPVGYGQFWLVLAGQWLHLTGEGDAK